MDAKETRHVAAAAAGAELSPEFVALLRCPNCPDRPPLAYRREAGTLDCARCGRRYPVVDGLPDLRAGMDGAGASRTPDGDGE